MPCDTRLRCGHLCPYKVRPLVINGRSLMFECKCHSDDPNHIAVTCVQSCRRLCSGGHPCSKQCAVPCGECQFPIADVELPCGHRKSTIPWCVP